MEDRRDGPRLHLDRQLPRRLDEADPAAADALKPSSALLARYKLDAPIRGEPGIPFPRIAALPFHYANPVSGRAPERLVRWTDIQAKCSR